MFGLPRYFLAGQPLASTRWGDGEEEESGGAKNNRKNGQEEKRDKGKTPSLSAGGGGAPQKEGTRSGASTDKRQTTATGDPHITTM